jgi:methenyltetrahydrofolate cyclohydrolase
LSARPATQDILGGSVEELLAQLAAETASPGGGLAAGVCVAMAAGLVAGVARASGESWEGAGAALAQAERLRSRVAPLPGLNVEAYDAAMRELAARDGGESEQRDARIEAALTRAAEVPLTIAEAAADVAELAALVCENGADGQRADAAAAAILAEASARAADRLVAVNLTTVAGGPMTEAASHCLRRAQEARESATAATE